MVISLFVKKKKKKIVMQTFPFYTRARPVTSTGRRVCVNHMVGFTMFIMLHVTGIYM